MAAAGADDALNTRWALWFHGSKNNNWGRDSYAILDVARRAGDVARMRSFFEAPDAPEGSVERRRDEQMLFFMREVRDPRTGQCRLVYPIWEDPTNVNGGTVCVSGDLAEMHRVFWDFVVLAAGESLFEDAESGVAMVNGVSIGAKRDGLAATVKVWCRACPPEPPEAGTMTPGERAHAAMRGWCAAARAHVERREAYFVPYKKVSQKDRRDSDRKLAAEYSKEKRLQDSELNSRHRRRRPHNRGGRNRRRGYGENRTGNRTGDGNRYSRDRDRGRNAGGRNGGWRSGPATATATATVAGARPEPGRPSLATATATATVAGARAGARDALSLATATATATRAAGGPAWAAGTGFQGAEREVEDNNKKKTQPCFFFNPQNGYWSSSIMRRRDI